MVTAPLSKLDPKLFRFQKILQIRRIDTNTCLLSDDDVNYIKDASLCSNHDTNAHQPTYLPWLGLFRKIALADAFVSYNQVQYQVDNWNNGNKILTEWIIMVNSACISHWPSRRYHSNINIDQKNPWRRKHWTKFNTHTERHLISMTIVHFEDIYSKEWEKLVHLNEYLPRALRNLKN